MPNIDKYKDVDGLYRSVPGRKWSSIHADTPLPSGSPYQIKRKPDIVLVEATEDLHTLEWSKILVCSETTTVNNNPVTEAMVKEKSYIMFMEQDNRCFVPAVYFQNDRFGFHMYDRNRLQTYRAPLQSTHSPSHLLRIFTHLFFGRPAAIGYDETMSCEEGRAKRVKQCGDWWDVDRELHRSASFIGRSTKCWVVSLKREGSDDIIRQVMKDTWANVLTADNEYKILKRIQNINGGRSLPQLYNWSRVPVPIGDSVEDDSTARRDHPDAIARVHCRLVSGPVAYPLTCFVNLKDFVGALVDATQGICSFAL